MRFIYLFIKCFSLVRVKANIQLSNRENATGIDELYTDIDTCHVLNGTQM